MYVKMNLVVLSLIFFLVVGDGCCFKGLLRLFQNIISFKSNRIENGPKNIKIEDSTTPDQSRSNRNLPSLFPRKSDPVTSPGSFNQFGCSFASSGYDLSDNPNPTSWQGKLPPCVWGNEVEPLVLSSDEDLTALITSVEAIQRQVTETLLFNTIDSYIRFYADYKNSGLDFLSFYSRYRPPLNHENCIGLDIEALNRIYSQLTYRWPKIASHTYLASCRANVTEDWGPGWNLKWEAKWGKEENHVESQLIGTNVEHVLAVLKIEVQGRSGYILLDAGYPWSSPGILMFDKQYPQKDQIEQYDIQELNRLTLMLNNSYVHWEVISKDRTRVCESHLIYVRQPYCSFLDNTEKRDLVRPLRIFIRRNRKGDLVGGLLIYTNTKYENTSKPAVVVHLENQDGKHVRHLVPLTYLSQTGIAQNLPSHKDLTVLSSVSKLLNMTLEGLLDKLQQVESILDDKTFVQGCKEVNDKLDNKI